MQLGDSRVGLDAPPGFADTIFMGSPRLQELAETLTSASNRILLFALTDSDMRRFSVGDTPDFRRYMLIVTPKGMEREFVTPKSFVRLVSDSLRDLTAPPKGADLQKYLEERPVGALSLLAELRKDDAVTSVLQGMRLPPTRSSSFFNPEKPQYVLSTTSLMLVRGKALNLTVYTLYDSPADADWIRLTTRRWIEDLQRINAR